MVNKIKLWKAFFLFSNLQKIKIAIEKWDLLKSQDSLNIPKKYIAFQLQFGGGFFSSLAHR